MKKDIIMLCVRIPMEMREEIKKAAMNKKISMMSWVIKALDKELKGNAK